MKGRIEVEGKDGFKRVSNSLENLPAPEKDFMKEGIDIVR